MTISSILSKLNMEIGRGLVHVDQLSQAANESEFLALIEAKKFQADYVYFRRFENNQHSIPQVFIYERDFSDEDLVGVHTKLWSSGIVPLFYTVTKSQIKVFNCTKSVIKNRGKLISKPLEIFSLVGRIQQELEYQKYSAKLFDNGTFWEQHSNLLNAADSPYQKLLDGLLKAKKNLEKNQSSLSTSTINKLLIIGVLVRYLEEKEDINGTKLLEISRDLYDKFPNSYQFTDILRNAQITDFLKELDLKFNGNVFNTTEVEKQELADANLEYVAAIFDANIDENRQFVFWKLYSFNHLPIELISGIYEAFLKKKKGVVYTPPFLVNALIDECMPLYRAEELFEYESFKVLDPACGSGIFLVAALKRMVQWKAISNYKKTGNFSYPDVETIQRIIRKNIFGVDLEEGATLISIFSLSIAICDKLSPMQIWQDLRFDKKVAEENIQTADFFKVYHQFKEENFDLVIGNPPFNPLEGYTNKSYLAFIKKEYKIEPSHDLNDDNIALLFWDKATLLRKTEGKICFVLPAGAWLYNNNAIEYRSHYLSKYPVSKIYDFTHLSDKLFHGNANVAVCAVIAEETKELSDSLLHIVVKRSKVAEDRFAFEIDHYDFHQIKYKTALENPLVWKANLLGGGRLLRLIDYLTSLRSLGEFLEEKKGKNWSFGEGYITRHDGSKSEEILIKEKYIKADWITDKNTLETQNFMESGFSTKSEKETYFWRPRQKNKSIFQPPHILIKENLGKEQIPMIFSEEYLCFKDQILGIHAPESERKNLKTVYDILDKNSLLNRLCCICQSGKAGISMSNQVILKKDIMNLPFPENPEDSELGYSETIVQNDVLNFYIKLNASSENSPLNQVVTTDELNEFGEVFCNILNPIYQQNEQEWFVKRFVIGATATAAIFCYGKPSKNALNDVFDTQLENIETLIQNNTNSNVRISRILREYLHIDGYDILILIKPKTIRYWLKSIALRDADETFADLKRTGF